MTRGPSRLVPVIFLLLTVWVVVYWTWKPRTGAITRDSGGAGAFDKPADLAGETTPPIPAAATRPDALLPPTPVAPTPMAPIRLGDKFNADGSLATPQSTTPRIIPPQFDEYTLIKGDTSFAIISRRLFDTPAHAAAIAASNPYSSPDRLKPGATIRIPRDPTNIQGKVAPPQVAVPAIPAGPTPPPDDRTIHTVQPGETLSHISQQHYGTAKLWKRILDANQATLTTPDRLKPGMQLTIPPKE